MNGETAVSLLRRPEKPLDDRHRGESDQFGKTPAENTIMTFFILKTNFEPQGSKSLLPELNLTRFQKTVPLRTKNGLSGLYFSLPESPKFDNKKETFLENFGGSNSENCRLIVNLNSIRRLKQHNRKNRRYTKNQHTTKSG